MPGKKRAPKGWSDSHKSKNSRLQKIKDASKKGRATGVLISSVGRGRLNGRRKEDSPVPSPSGFLTKEADQLIPGQGIIGYNFKEKDEPEVVKEIINVEDQTSSKPVPESTGHTNEGEDFLAFSDDEGVNEEMNKRFTEFEAKEEQEQDAQRQKQFAKVPLPIPDYPSPWLQKHPNCSLTQQFSKEIDDFVKHVSPTESDNKTRADLVARIRSVIRQLWPDCRAHVFGSYATGMHLPGADIDMVVLSRDQRLNSRTQLYRLADRVRRHGYATKVEVISRARVPIIKFIDASTKIPVDISFEQPTATRAVEKVQGWVQEIPAVKPLAMVLKQFLRRRRLNDVAHGFLGGYSTICMVVSFLKNHPEVSANRIDPLENLGVLLLEFFVLYGETFDYSKYALGMTGDMEYVSKRKSIDMQSTTPDALAIQDPNDPGNNVARSSFNYHVVRKEFSHAADLLKRMSYEYAKYEPEVRCEKSFLAALVKSDVNLAQPVKQPESTPIDDYDLILQRRSKVRNEIHSILEKAKNEKRDNKARQDLHDRLKISSSPSHHKRRSEKSSDDEDAENSHYNVKRKSKKEGPYVPEFETLGSKRKNTEQESKKKKKKKNNKPKAKSPNGQPQPSESQPAPAKSPRPKAAQKPRRQSNTPKESSQPKPQIKKETVASSTPKNVKAAKRSPKGKKKAAKPANSK